MTSPELILTVNISYLEHVINNSIYQYIAKITIAVSSLIIKYK